MNYGLQHLTYVHPVKLKGSDMLISSYKANKKYGDRDSILVFWLKLRDCQSTVIHSVEDNAIIKEGFDLVARNFPLFYKSTGHYFQIH